MPVSKRPRSESFQTASSRPPIWVFARSKRELEDYCRIYRKPIERYNLIETPEQFRVAVPVGKPWRLLRTGTWYLMEEEKQRAIELLIEERLEYMG